LAQIILRLIPEPQELRRLLPQIKETLTEVGMPQDEYLDLIDKLKKELENEDLTRILEESSDAIGVDSVELIDELKKNPDQAAKLIYLASEISKGAGDESALADILVEYVEKVTTQAAMEAGEDVADGDAHLKKVVTNVESALLQQLGKLNVGDDVLGRMENRINERMDSILDKMRVEWLNAQAGVSRKEKHIRLSVLQTLEHSVNEDEELAEILKLIRAKVEAGEIEENNYSQIDAEITQQRKKLQKEAAAFEIPEGVLNSDELMFILEKEIARANRYNAPFSALAFSFVSAKPKMKALKDIVSADAIMTAALEKLAGTIREVDYIGQIGKNKMVALLPMIAYPAAKSALGRVTNLLHAKPLMVHEVPVDLRVAGVVAEYDAEHMPNAQAFAKQLSNQLMDMVARIKNIQVLF
jgi:GGDEF domain-containing protein